MNINKTSRDEDTRGREGWAKGQGEQMGVGKNVVKEKEEVLVVVVIVKGK